MSTTIDNRVVEMRFDNKEFEKNISTTRSSVEGLKKSLDFSASIGSVNLLGNSFGDMFKKVAQFRAINKIIDGVTGSIRNLSNQFSTLASAKSGFSEYELKMGSIQTIMAGTGESLDKVNKKLNELNEYSDKTIYSFSDMTSNIGKFTNAGVKLDDAVDAIKGVSNVAALSGANANEASRAMYNFAQALSSGYVKLIDWKSIENANMATVGFKNALIETAVETNVLTKAENGMYKTLSGKTFNATSNFNDCLQEQWMTSDVLIKTLAKYTDESTELGEKATKAATKVKTFTMLIDTLKEAMGSGWAQTWEIVVGDLDTATELFTKISNVVGGFIGEMSDKRNKLLEDWVDLGGRTAVLDGLKTALSGLWSIIKTVGNAFQEVFPPITASALHQASIRFKELAERLKPTEEQLKSIKKISKGVFSIIKLFATSIKSLLKPIITMIKSSSKLKSLAKTIVDLLVKFSDWIIKINETGKAAKVFTKAGNIIAKVISKIGSVAAIAFKAIWNFIKNIPNTVEAGRNVVEGFLKGIKEKIKNVGEKAVEIGKKFLNSLKDFLGIHSPSRKAYEVAVDFFLGLFEGIASMLSKLKEKATEIGTTIINAIKGVFSKKENQTFGEEGLVKSFEDSTTRIEKATTLWENITTRLESVFDRIRKMFDKIKPYFEPIVKVLVTWWNFIAFLFDTAIEHLKKIFPELKKAFESGDLDKILDIFRQLFSIQLIKNISDLIKSFSNIGDKILDFSKAGEKAMKSLIRVFKAESRKLNAEALLTFAKALLFLAAALFVFCMIPDDEIGNSLKLMGEISAGMLAVLAIMSAIGKFLGTTIVSSTAMFGMILGFTLGILILAGALKILSKITKKEFESGKEKMLYLVDMVSLFAIACGLSKASFKGFFGFSLGILILIGCVAILNKMSIEQYENGMLKLAGLVLMVGLGSILLGIAARIGKGNKAVGGILSMTVAILAIVYAIKQINQIGAGEFLVALLIVGLMLSLLIGVIYALVGATKLLKGNKIVSVIATMITMLLSLYALLYVIKEVSNMTTDKMWQGLEGVGLMIAGLIVMFGALALLGKFITVKTLVAMVLAIAIVGLIGALFLAISKITSDPESLRKNVETMAIAIGIFVVALLALAAIGQFLWLGIVVIVAALVLLTGCLYVASLAFETITNSLVYFMQNVKAEEVFGMFLSIAGGILALGLAIGLLSLFTPGIFITAVALGLLAAALLSLTVALGVAMSLFLAFIAGVKALFGLDKEDNEFSNIGKDLIRGFINGIKSMFGFVKNAVSTVFGGVISFVKGIFGSHSPSKVFKEIGEDCDKGLINGVNGFSDKVKESFGNMAKEGIDGFKNGLGDGSRLFDGLTDGLDADAFKSFENGLGNFDGLFDDLNESNPTITPVLDLSSIESGAKDIPGMLGNDYALSLNTGFGSNNMSSLLNNGYSTNLASEATSNSGGVNVGGNYTVNMSIYGAQGQDVNQLAELVSEKINNSIRRRENAW